jgi:hypothetical protein
MRRESLEESRLATEVDIPIGGNSTGVVDIPLSQKQPPSAEVIGGEVDIPVIEYSGEIGPIKGFRNNLRLPYHSWQQFLHGKPRGALEDNLIINLIQNLTGNTEENRMREKYGDVKVDEIIAKEKEARRGISISAMKDAYDEDPGAFLAEFVNGMVADPELLITPMGWRTAAAKTAAALKTAGAIKKTVAANVAGAGGAAATAAALVAPISMAQQVNESGEINWDQVGEETALAAGMAVVLGSLGAKRFPAEKALEIAESTAGAAQVMAVAKTQLGDMFDEVVESAAQSKFGQSIKWFADKTGAKAISYIDDAAKHSPTLRALRNKIEYKEFSKEAIEASHFERVSSRTGEFVTRLQDIMDRTRTGFFGVIKKSDNDELLRALRGGKHNITSKALRSLYDDIRQYAIDAGMDVGEVANYFTRRYVPKLLRKNEDEFIKVLTDHGIDAGDATLIHRRILDNDGIYDTSAKVGRMDEFGNMLTAKAKNLEKSRTLDIPDEALAKFLDNDVYSVMRKYITNTVKRSEFVRDFGANGGRLNKALKQSMEEMKAAGRPMKRHELKRVYDMVDAIQGMYRPFESRGVAKASKVMATYQIVRTLPLATLSSITEPLVILSRGHYSSSLKAVPKLIEHTAKSWVRILNKKYPKPEVTRAVERVGVALDDSVAEVLTQTFGGESNKLTHAFFKATLLSQWTRMNRIWAYHAGRQMIIDNLSDISKGKKWRYEAMHHELTELGVPVRDGVEWLRRGMPDDEFATNFINNGALRFTNEVVMSPRVTNRPLWHSNPNVHLLAQLKGFPTTFGNTVLKRWFVKIVEDPIYQGPKIAAIGAAMTMVAMLVNDMRDEVKGTERNETEYERVIRAGDRAGLTGIGQMAVDSLYAHRYGRSGLSQLMGPFWSQMDALLAALGEAKEGNLDPLREEAASAIPILSQSKDARRDVEEALGK